MIPIDYLNCKTISGGAHAIIYSKLYRNKILKINQIEIIDWDHLIITNSIK